MNRVDIAGVVARLRRDYPQWTVTHHATAAAPGGIFLARRPVPTDDGPEAFAAAASDEQEMRRRLDIQESLAQRLINLSRGSLALDHDAEVAAVIADLEDAHPRWRLSYEIGSLGATFTARRTLPPHHADLGLLGTVTAPSAQELSWRLASQDAQIAAVSMAEGPEADPAESLTDTVAGFEDLLRRAAGET
ncbi:hypothetical protein GCM10023224_16080 [Streptomonospora halophila]|uniref:Uncharacterized protein n=1 Tax=Streptomonospora halophila TaxID=427369 RepID=A0ABP9GAY7_9ACTN